MLNDFYNLWEREKMTAKSKDDATISQTSNVTGETRITLSRLIEEKKRRRKLREMRSRREQAHGLARRPVLNLKEDYTATRVCFGSVQVEVRVPKSGEERNIKVGQTALARALGSIFKPGIKLDVAKGVPLFHADPSHPGKIVREVNGKRDVGTFISGKFKVSR